MVSKLRIKGHFIPAIPLNWIGNALLLQGNVNATKLALYIWYRQGLSRKKADLVISSKKAEELFGVNQRSFTKALDDLENVGMVTTIRGVGKSPRVTVISHDFEKIGVDQN